MEEQALVDVLLVVLLIFSSYKPFRLVRLEERRLMFVVDELTRNGLWLDFEDVHFLILLLFAA